MVVLPLCACLLGATSAQAAENQVLSVSGSETERLRELIIRKQINALLTDDNRLRGQIQEVQDGFLAIDIKKSTGPSSPWQKYLI